MSDLIKVETPECMVCGRTSLVEMTEEQYEALKKPGRYVQQILPDWTAEQRELVITGTHPECWASFMPDPEE